MLEFENLHLGEAEILGEISCVGFGGGFGGGEGGKQGQEYQGHTESPDQNGVGYTGFPLSRE